MNAIMEKDDTYLASTYRRFPVQVVSGHGSVFTDDTGKDYIDMGTGIAVNTFGLCDESWMAAVTDQMTRFQHTSNLYYSEPCAVLAEALCRRTGMKKVFFSNSGAEANECAIKAVRQYGASKKGADCYWIVTLENSFHGRTLTTLAATGQAAFHSLYQPLTPGFVSVPANDVEALVRTVKDIRCAGILLETVQGEGGVNPLSQAYLAAVAKLAREEDLITVADEVQCGNGRSGRLYAYMNTPLVPDVVTTAKGLGGGLPIGATLLGEKVADVFTPGSHGSTFGGNPVCCAGAMNILERLDEDTLAGVRERSDWLFRVFAGKSGIRSVTGMGLMIGLETEKPASEVAAACLEQGVAVLTAKNKVRLLPALNIPMELLHKAADIIISVCAVS